MASIIDQLARGVRDALNAAPHGSYSGLYVNWATQHPAQWRHLPAYKREDLGDLRVVVSSDPDESHTFDAEFRSRCCESPFQYRVYVGIAKKAVTFDENLEEYSAQDEFEALKELVECIAIYLNPLEIVANGMRFQPLTMEFTPFWDRQSWSESRVFMSILSVTYQ